MTFPINYPYKPELMQFLGESPEVLKRLTTLDLHGCWLHSYISIAGPDKICQTIESCQDLEILDLSGNAIGSLVRRGSPTQIEAFKKLFVTLTHLPKLREVKLSQNRLDLLNEEGLKFLCECFANCQNLRQIFIEGNNLDPDKIQYMQRGIEIINSKKREIVESQRDSVRAVTLCWKFCGVHMKGTAVSDLPTELIEKLLIDSSLVDIQQDGAIRVTPVAPIKLKV
jgi:Ran GTPase-activating protein (RanGAP) involved in mRNA processing and transport